MNCGVQVFVFLTDTFHHLLAQDVLVDLCGFEHPCNLVVQPSDLYARFGFGRCGQSDVFGGDACEDSVDRSEQVAVGDLDQLSALFILAQPSLLALVSAVVSALHSSTADGTFDGDGDLEDIRLSISVLLGVTDMLGLLQCRVCFFVEDHRIGFFSEVPFILDDPFESCLVPTDDFGHIFDLFLIEPSRYGEEGLSVEVRLTDPLDDLALLGM